MEQENLEKKNTKEGVTDRGAITGAQGTNELAGKLADELANELEKLSPEISPRGISSLRSEKSETAKEKESMSEEKLSDISEFSFEQKYIEPKQREVPMTAAERSAPEKKEVPAPTPAPAPEKEALPGIRTYRGDMGKYAKESSYLDIVSKAVKRKKVHAEVEQRPFLRLAIIGGVVAVSLAILAAGLYFIFTREPAEKPEEVIRAPRPAITANKEVIISFKAGDGKDLAAKIQNNLSIPQISGSITYLPILEEAEAGKAFLDMGGFLSALGMTASRNIADNAVSPFMLGIIDTFGQNEIVLISRVSDYESAFAAMFGWEKDILNDFKEVLPKNKKPEALKAAFEDAVIKNQDARVLYNIERQPILAYAIFNKKFLVITSSKAALEAVLEKMIVSPPLD